MRYKIDNPFKDISNEGFEMVIKKMTAISGKPYYSLLNILERKTDYIVVIGERTNGKTTNALALGLLLYIFSNGNIQTGLLRRWDTDFSRKYAKQVMDNIIKLGWVNEWTSGKYNSIVYFGNSWYLSKYNEKGEKVLQDAKPCVMGFALNCEEHYKSTAYPGIHYVVFDEFISRTYYLPEEFVVFQNVLSTIIRVKDDMKIVMLGNTINMFCPYFSEMGLSNIKKMKKTDIDIYQYGKSGLTVGVEFSDFKASKKPSDKYFAFNNPKLNMIRNGAWEINIYPHLPYKYKPSDIVFMYFIEFDGELLQCEVINVENSADVFTYIHRKTTPLKLNNELVFQPAYSPKPGYYRNMMKNVDKRVGKINWFFEADKVFYQDNEVGEVVRNYRVWCMKNDS